MKLIKGSFGLLLFITACSPHKNSLLNRNEGTQFRIASTSEKTAECELKIRKDMIDKKIQFDQASQFQADVNLTNQAIKNAKNPEFNLLKTNGEITEVTVHFSGPEKNSFFKLDYSLSLPEDGADGILALSVDTEMIGSESIVLMGEEFVVSESCELKMTEISKQQINQIKPQKYTFKSETLYLNGELETETDKFSVLPGQEPLLNFYQNEDISKYPRKIYAYYPEFKQVITVDIASVGQKNQNDWGLSLNFDVFKMTIHLQEQSIIQTYHIDSLRKINLIDTDLFKTQGWTVPKEIWEKSLLGTTRNLNQSVESLLPKDFFVENNSFQVTMLQEPNYDHFSAYWKILSSNKKESESGYEIQIIENETARTQGEASSIDLESNETIQVTLPEIQNIAKSINSKEPANRLAQIRLILDYLKTNYVYDYEMLKNNIIRSLSTEQALKRGKGVCQHYSVLFTAIARALKIPTRIVSGYFLGGEAPGYHAWVESEVEPGIWQAIEPQDSLSLTQMKTRFYFPTSRARFLEDKNVSAIADTLDLFKMNYKFKPVK